VTAVRSISHKIMKPSAGMFNSGSCKRDTAEMHIF